MFETSRIRSTAAAMLIAIAAAMPSAMPSAKADAPISALTGHWRVAGVAVSDAGVQALGDDDPSLMGKRLTFTPERLTWDRPPSTGDACLCPSFEPLARIPPDVQPALRKLGMRRPVAYALHCRSGSWGPGNDPTVYRGAAGALALPWYDGAVLMLVRRSP